MVRSNGQDIELLLNPPSVGFGLQPTAPEFDPPSSKTFLNWVFVARPLGLVSFLHFLRLFSPSDSHFLCVYVSNILENGGHHEVHEPLWLIWKEVFDIVNIMASTGIMEVTTISYLSDRVCPCLGGRQKARLVQEGLIDNGWRYEIVIYIALNSSKSILFGISIVRVAVQPGVKDA